MILQENAKYELTHPCSARPSTIIRRLVDRSVTTALANSSDILGSAVPKPEGNSSKLPEQHRAVGELTGSLRAHPQSPRGPSAKARPVTQ